jgi:adenylate cyclase, class 2
MKEIELKILDVNPKDEEEKLKKLGFKKVWEGIILEKSFDSKTGDLKKRKELLRLRRAYDKVELTFKGKKEKHPHLRVREEIEVHPDSFEKMEDILNALGFESVSTREKKRISYKYEEVKAEIDEYSGLKPYMELEGSEREVMEMLNKLNYTINDTTNKSSKDLLKEHGLNTKKLFFEKEKK